VPNQALQQTGHATQGSSCFNVSLRVSRLLSLLLELTTEPGLPFLLSSGLQEDAPTDSKRGLLVVLNEDDPDRAVVPAWVKTLRNGREVRLLAPRGSVFRKWSRKSPPNYVERSLALLGQTLDEGRVRDIVSAMRLLQEGPGQRRSWTVAGRGQAGILAVYAALLEPSIKEVVIVDPPKSHRDGPIFLNVLRVLDIPEALGLLAPRRLTLINAKDKAFDRTEEIYRLAGAADKLQRK
jgi:hypothetical protein